MQTIRKYHSPFSRRVIITSSGLMSIPEPTMRNNPYATYYTPFQRQLADLLRDERTGKFLTHDEKQTVKRYAEEQRKKNQHKRK